MAGELAKTISDRANGTDEEVHKPDYSYESDLMKRIDCAWKEPVE